jgi:hypothetical protein
MPSALLLVALLTASACVRTPRLLRPPHPLCWDGLPVRILQDPACPPEGVCGYSCLPGRWVTKE